MSWINVKDRLPEKFQPVLCYRQGGKNNPAVQFGQYNTILDDGKPNWIATSGGFYTYYGLSIDGSEITHWMPLPYPPNEFDNSHQSNTKESE